MLRKLRLSQKIVFLYKKNVIILIYFQFLQINILLCDEEIILFTFYILDITFWVTL